MAHGFLLGLSNNISNCNFIYNFYLWLEVAILFQTFKTEKENSKVQNPSRIFESNEVISPDAESLNRHPSVTLLFVSSSKREMHQASISLDYES